MDGLLQENSQMHEQPLSMRLHHFNKKVIDWKNFQAMNFFV